MVAGTPTLRLSDVIAEVRTQFGDTSNTELTDAMVARWVNQAQTEIIAQNGFNKAAATQSSVAGTQTFTLPTDVVQVESIQFDGAALQNLSFEEANNRFRGNQLGTGTPTTWFVWGNSVYLYPVPDSVKNLTIFYVKAPNIVSSPADMLSCPDRYFNAIVEFCMSRAFAMDEDWPAQQVKSAAFDKNVRENMNTDGVAPGTFFVIGDSDAEAYATGIYYGW